MGITTDAAATFVSRALYDPLVHLSKDYEVTPGLAESWSANEDATEFTFNLATGVKWHDGEPFTSRDVKFYFDEMMALHPLGAPIKAVYKETLTPDDKTAIVKLSAPFAPLVRAMTAHAMLPAHLYEGTDVKTNPANLNPVGTGPFAFKSFTSGDSVILDKNDNYWGEQGDVDSIVYRVMPDATARSLAFQSGEVDLPINLPLSQITTMKGNDRFAFETATMAEHLYGFYNTANPILRNYEVRSALYQAMDRKAIAEKVFQDTGTPSVGPVPNQVTWALDPSTDFTKQFAFDLESAAEALDKAGYPAGADGTRFSLTLNFLGSNPLLVGTAELIKANFETIGVHVNLVGQEANVYAEDTFTKHAFDLTLVNLGAFADPSLGVARAFVCNPENLAYRNPTGVCDPAIDAAFVDIATIADPEQRLAAMKKAADAVASVLGTIPLISNNQVESYRADKWDGIEKFNSRDRWDWSGLVAKG
ncbi:ABC transporter substrate-binding protein [Arthrobacter sp. W4I7]|uniref:ABC transporter substrate-binding protein n=1 Tax=Arthrobacter sp. W4I7 TaxID=3042296 RepID=UPI0027D843B3|nr:ABC transporter substrate-binding protein [Arthrobacter sp. W4I7]